MVRLCKSSSPTSTLQVKVCDTFLSKLIGLMFSREIKPDYGILLVENRASRINSSIHMLFMNYDITALWLDKDMVIIDKALARKWAPFYMPKQPAQYVLELHPSKFTEYSIGDQLIIAQ